MTGEHQAAGRPELTDEEMTAFADRTIDRVLAALAAIVDGDLVKLLDGNCAEVLLRCARAMAPSLLRRDEIARRLHRAATPS
jgi:hypothetical protein